jgi:hypothetical protein
MEVVGTVWAHGSSRGLVRVELQGANSAPATLTQIVQPEFASRSTQLRIIPRDRTQPLGNFVHYVEKRPQAGVAAPSLQS